MVEPDNLKAKEALRFITQRSGLEPKVSIISQIDFNNVLKQYRTLRSEVQKALRELKEEIETEEKIKQKEAEQPDEEGKEASEDEK